MTLGAGGLLFAPLLQKLAATADGKITLKPLNSTLCGKLGGRTTRTSWSESKNKGQPDFMNHLRNLFLVCALVLSMLCGY